MIVPNALEELVVVDSEMAWSLTPLYELCLSLFLDTRVLSSLAHKQGSKFSFRDHLRSAFPRGFDLSIAHSFTDDEYTRALLYTGMDLSSGRFDRFMNSGARLT